jgi:hypothetical protein
MRSFHVSWFFLFSLVITVAGAGQKSPAQEATSGLKLLSVRHHWLGASSVVYIWDCEATGVKEITLRLVVSSDGKSKLAQEKVFQWKKTVPSQKVSLLFSDLNSGPDKSQYIAAINVYTDREGKGFPNFGVPAKNTEESYFVEKLKTQPQSYSNSTNVEKIGFSFPEGKQAVLMNRIWSVQKLAEISLKKSELDGSILQIPLAQFQEGQAEWTKAGGRTAFMLVEWKSFGNAR